MARIFLRIGFPFSIVFDEFWIGSFCRVASRGKIIFAGYFKKNFRFEYWNVDDVWRKRIKKDY